MNLKEFKERIDRLYSRSRNPEEERVTISIHVVGTVGPHPTTNIKSIDAGFDWNAGMIMIEPEVLLKPTTMDEVKAIQKQVQSLGWDLYEMKNLKAENARLKKELKGLRNE